MVDSVVLSYFPSVVGSFGEYALCDNTPNRLVHSSVDAQTLTARGGAHHADYETEKVHASVYELCCQFLNLCFHLRL